MEPEKVKENHNKYTVCVRIRPNLQINSQSVFSAHSEKKVRQFKEKSIVTYSFDKVFEPQHNNEYIYDKSVQNVVNHFLHRKINTTFLAYGQTGSGKTHTLFGQRKNDSDREKGLTEYILDDIVKFHLGKKDIVCSFMQIYKQKVTDLLSGKQITLRQNNKNELVIGERTVVKVESYEQIINTLYKANSNKIFGNSYVHSQSSRSHVIFTVQIGNTQLNVVDLCGSQVLTYKFDEKQRQQTNSINLSLFTLNAVINDLCDKNKNKFIPFRNSVLTRLLKNSLIHQGKTQIYLFCNISPQLKHQQFSSSTLRFGQIAISIDESQNIGTEKVQNLSQKKRDMKKVDNIIEISPKENTSFEKPPSWEVTKRQIMKEKVICYEMKIQGNKDAFVNILLLHAYGHGCCGDDWDYFIPYFTKNISANLYSVDFPGFGNSSGKKFTSRSQNFSDKGQPMDFMKDLFKSFGFSQKNKVVLIGYDLGGAIALSASMHDTLKKIISGICVFHPTWTDKVQKLAMISLPVQLLWVPVETFHLVSAGQKMSKVIKGSVLYKLNIGPYTGQKAGGYYTRYSKQMGKLMEQFIQNIQPIEQKVMRRGKIQEEIIEIDINKEEQEFLKKQQAVRTFYSLIKQNKWRQVFDSILKGGENKPKYVRLASQLPTISPQINSDQLVKMGLFDEGPKNSPQLLKLPLLPSGRQVHIKTKINLSVLDGQNDYLVLDKNGEQGLTHRAYICEGQSEQNIEEEDKILVEVDRKQKSKEIIKVNLSKVIQLNSQTLFRSDHSGNLVFQDSVTCKYSSLITKLMLARCTNSIKNIVPKIDLSVNSHETLNFQKQCTKRIFQQMDLRHLVHEGIENIRFTGTDVGKLAYFGQGNCHHLASVLGALLLPFGKILGWDVIFRAGSFFSTGRDIDQNGNPLPKWNGKPNTKVQDHTWLQIVYKPSFKVFVFDPSFAICNAPISKIYTFEGKMHISGKNQCSSYAPGMPELIYGTHKAL